MYDLKKPSDVCVHRLKAPQQTQLIFPFFELFFSDGKGRGE